MHPPLIYSGWFAVAFWIAFGVWWLPEMFGTVIRHRVSGIQVHDRGSFAVLFSAFFVGFGFAFLFTLALPEATITWEQVPVFVVGLVLLLLGVALRWYAIWTLGKYFTSEVTTRSDQSVMQTGPYRLIRHPGYTGTLLTMVGVGLAMTNWASAAALLLCVSLGHLYRIWVEERALCQTLGPAYSEYMQHTKRLIPFVF
jgi:protein-S-isoprenylcysteine O-methyltransferase Ste14